MNWQEVLADILILLPDLLSLPLITGGSFISIIGSIPKMIRVWNQLRKLEIDAEHLLEVVQKIPVMEQAIREAQETGSTASLEALFGKPKP